MNHFCRLMQIPKWLRLFLAWILISIGLPLFLTPIPGGFLVAAAGGVATLAHPAIDGVDRFIALFAEQGIRAIEAYCPAHSAAQTQYYVNVAAKLGLAVSGGSDCHGDGPEGAPIGSTEFPAVLVDRLERLAEASS